MNQGNQFSFDAFKTKADSVFGWVVGIGGYEDAIRDLYSLVVSSQPEMTHPKIQAIIGDRARKDCELQLVTEILRAEDPSDISTGLMEYWGPLHDHVAEIAKKAQNTPEELEKHSDVRAALTANDRDDLEKESISELEKNAARYLWLRNSRMKRNGIFVDRGRREITKTPHQSFMVFNYWGTASQLDESIDAEILKTLKDQDMSNPNNCHSCDHKNHPDGGHCYMFKKEPKISCSYHTFSVESWKAMARRFREAVKSLDDPNTSEDQGADNAK